MTTPTTGHFYPRSPCGERPEQDSTTDEVLTFLSTLSLRRATRKPSIQVRHLLFLSTLSLRRATPAERHANSQQEFLSTLSLRRATRFQAADISARRISIHALLAESDIHFFAKRTGKVIFLSTLSLRRATRLGLLGWLRVLISIHALLAESDALR